MQFVRNGPDIPERLLQAHEDGRVVFFCGAGISYRAGLPGFKGLTAGIFERLHMVPNSAEKAAMDAGRFDVAIGILESRHVNGRAAVRQALADTLQPEVSRQNATATHAALLTLARDAEDRTRLITTNFDRLFEHVASGAIKAIERFKAPLLPVPKRRWSGLVYLHGLLDEAPTPESLERLVVSSGDFGLAYLTERWAARFVSELLRNYVVVFVGYSLTDPVLRYMTDALAADQLLGEEPLEMFAFANHVRGKEQREAEEWRWKNVTPILYRNHARHYYLHRTLSAWAETYRDGVIGKARVVLDSAKAPPNLAPDRDDVASRVLWALSDPTGQPARQFATLDPVPSLEWLDVLSDVRHRRSDLSRFGVEPHRRDDSPEFAFTDRPAPVGLAQWMALTREASTETDLDQPMFWIGAWLARHMNDPRVLLWLAAQGGRLHSRFALEIERQLEKNAQIEKRGGAELRELLRNAPNAVPSPMMRAAWELILAGKVGHRHSLTDAYAWSRRVRREGLSARARHQLRALLAPRVVLRRAIRLDFLGEQPEEEPRQLDWDIVLSSDVEREDFTVEGSDGIEFGALLDDFNMLLRDALDLMRALGEADERDDPSYYHQPSIEEHPQNQRFHRWTLLIELARDAWINVAGSDPLRARLVAESWWLTPYPVFRRLALFAATQRTVISVGLAVEWLLEEGGWWLWSVCTHREVSRLLVALAPSLDEEQHQRVEEAIAEGPPRRMYVEDLDPDRWAEIVDDSVWQHLARMASGRELGETGRRKASEIAQRHPDWRLVVAERREFSTWIGQDVERPEAATPETTSALIEWLRENPRRDDWSSRDDWGRRCQEDYEVASDALRTLAMEGWWEPGRWNEALYAWTDEELVEKSWKGMSAMLVNAPDEILLAPGMGFWLRSVGRVVELLDGTYVALCDRVLDLAQEDDAADAESPVDRALNHPVGQVTEGLLDYALLQAGGEGLPAPAKRVLVRVCDLNAETYRIGRVMVASRVLPLLVRDEPWTRQHVLPMFDWNPSARDACLAWRGFLAAPRFHEEFLNLVRESFVTAARHYDDLGSQGTQYASLLAYAGLRLRLGWSTSLREAMEEMPDAGLQQMLSTLGRALEADERREDYFQNRVLPFLRRLWPKTTDKLTPGIAAGFARLCLVAEDAFPEVFRAVRGYLSGAGQRAPGYVVRSFIEKGYAGRFPEEALEFLHLVLEGASGVLPEDLRACLRAMGRAQPELGNAASFKALARLAGGTLE
ncbi:MAG: SIR2 family protein [Gammaproteobacteria bacterium]|nr:SIR2 family protein [Gammaproteobacteria bacterium]